MGRTWRNFAYALIQTSCDCSSQFSPTCNFRPLSDVRIPFPLDSVRTNGWNFTQFYIGKTFGGILPVCFHKFVTESWALVDIFTTWYALYRAIVWFSELDIAEACWPILFKILCVSCTLMSKPTQNASTMEFLEQNLKFNLTIQKFSPVRISLYPDSEQQTTNCL